MLDSKNFTNYALAKDGKAVSAKATKVSKASEADPNAALSFYAGQAEVSTTPTADKVYVGSSVDGSVISVPALDGSTSMANYMNLRMSFSSKFFHEIAVSPNSNGIYHRNVRNGNALEWKQLATTDSNVASATKATQDGSGNIITSTYATKTELSGKQATISDLSTIRNNAQSGATAYGWGNHANAGYTKNKGTVTSVKVQGTNGLTGSGTVTNSGTITISGITATTGATGVSKLVTGDLKSKTYAKGEAAAAAHTHSQYAASSHKHVGSDITGGTISVDKISGSTKFYSSTGSGKYYLLGSSSSSNDYSILNKNANVYMSGGTLYASSDERLKTYMGDVDGDLEKIKRIPKIYFHWNDDEEKNKTLGTFAQGVEEVYPELVVRDEESDIRGVAYDKLGIVALAGIDKLYEMVQKLEETNKKLEERVKELEEKLK